MKKTKSNKKPAIIGASIGAVIVTLVGGLAIGTKWFTNWKPITNAIKGGTVVETLTANALSSGTVTFANEDADVVASFAMSHGTYAIPEGAAATADEILTLGDESTASLTKTALETDLKTNLKMSNAKVESIESDVLALDLGKVSTLQSYFSVDWAIEETKNQVLAKLRSVISIPCALTISSLEVVISSLHVQTMKPVSTASHMKPLKRSTQLHLIGVTSLCSNMTKLLAI